MSNDKKCEICGKAVESGYQWTSAGAYVCRECYEKGKTLKAIFYASKESETAKHRYSTGTIKVSPLALAIIGEKTQDVIDRALLNMITVYLHNDGSRQDIVDRVAALIESEDGLLSEEIINQSKKGEKR